ncbi:hypothetical protein [Cedecea davisae]
MNRRLSNNLACRPGVRMLLAACISCFQPCRCCTHLGASQDPRAGL